LYGDRPRKQDLEPNHLWGSEKQNASPKVKRLFEHHDDSL